jgi:hypothetical protein
MANKSNVRPEIKWIAHNPITRSYETADLVNDEFVTGQTVMKLFWCQSVEKYCTIPGDCIYRLSKGNEWVLES